MLSVLRRYEMCVGVTWYAGDRGHVIQETLTQNMKLSNFSPRVARWQVAGDLTFPGKMQVVLISCWASRSRKWGYIFICPCWLYTQSNFYIWDQEFWICMGLGTTQITSREKLMVSKKTLDKYYSSTLWLYIIPCSITIKSEGNPSLVSCWADSEKRIIFSSYIWWGPNAEDDLMIDNV